MAMSKQWFAAMCFSAGAVGLFASPASAQIILSSSGFQLMGDGCPSQDAVRISVTNEPGTVTASEITVEFASTETTGFRVTGADAVSQCAVAIQVGSNAMREAKVTVESTSASVIAVNAGQGTQSVANQVRFGRGISRLEETVVTGTPAAAGVTPAPVTVQVDDLRLTSDIRPQGAAIVLMLELKNAGTDPNASLLMNSITLKSSEIEDVTG